MHSKHKVLSAFDNKHVVQKRTRSVDSPPIQMLVVSVRGASPSTCVRHRREVQGVS